MVNCPVCADCILFICYDLQRLQSELHAIRSSWDTYITQVSKDMVIKDTMLLTEREQITKLKEELNKCIEDVKR